MHIQVTKADLERHESARRAIHGARKFKREWQSMARMMSRNSKLKVELTGGATSCTDGKTLFIKVPPQLAEPLEHPNPADCSRRDEHYIPLCPSCDVLEDVHITVIHEVAHVIFGTFEEVTGHEKAQLLERAILSEAEGHRESKRAAILKRRIEQAPPEKKRDYLNLSDLISPYLPFLINACEDIRVNSRMHTERPGTRRMMNAQISKVFREGILGYDGKMTLWSETPPNAQAAIGVYCKVGGYDWKGAVTPEVAEALDDPGLDAICAKMATARTMRDVYRLSFPLLENLRRLGFMKAPDEPEDEPEPETPPMNQEDDQSEPDKGDDEQGSEDPGDQGGEEQPPAESPEQPGQGESSDSDGDEGDPSEADGGGQSPGEEGGGEQSDGSGGDDSSDRGDLEEAGTPPDADASTSDDAAGEDGSSGPAGDGPDGPEGAGAPGGSSSESDGSEVDPSDHIGDNTGGTDSEDHPSTDDSPTGEADANEAGGNPSDDNDGVDNEGEPGSGDSADPDEATSSGEEGASPSDGMGDPDAQEGPDSGDHSPQDGDAGSSDAEASADGAPDDSDSSGSPGGGDHGDQGQAAGPDAEASSPTPDSEGSPAVLGGDEGSTPSSETPRQTAPGQPEEAPGSPDTPEPSDGPTAPVGDTGKDGAEAPEPYTEEDQARDGTPSDIEHLFRLFGGHESHEANPSEAVEEELFSEAVDMSLRQMDFFDSPSFNVNGVNVHRMDDDHLHIAFSDGIRRAPSATTIEVPETIISGSLSQLRVVFQDNRRARHEVNRKSGKVNARVLATRVPTQDERIFKKTTQPGRKDYFVVIGIDCSGSTAAPYDPSDYGSPRLDLIKMAVYAKAEMLHRLAIPFALYAHSGSAANVEIFELKNDKEPWGKKQKEALAALQPYSGNLDGHALEFFRKVAERRQETDRLLMYYTDGAMPASNYKEELEILQREIKLCERLGIHLIGVGVNSDSPTEHGLDTILLDDLGDVRKVVQGLKERLLDK